MKVYRLHKLQVIPISMDEAWDFFVSPANLPLITPPDLGFMITSEQPTRMYQGMIICYRVTPFAGLQVTWVTEISHIEEPHFFVDEQRLGPYRFWHHQHLFREVPAGTEMTDLVHYALPFGVAGRLVAPLVKRRLEAIFSYRRTVLAERFGCGDSF